MHTEIILSSQFRGLAGQSNHFTLSMEKYTLRPAHYFTPTPVQEPLMSIKTTTELHLISMDYMTTTAKDFLPWNERLTD